MITRRRFLSGFLGAIVSAVTPSISAAAALSSGPVPIKPLVGRGMNTPVFYTAHSHELGLEFTRALSQRCLSMKHIQVT